VLGPAATAPLPPAAAAAAAAAAADANPGGIFDGLWRLQQEAGQVWLCFLLLFCYFDVRKDYQRK
jgi:hypothetical protein